MRKPCPPRKYAPKFQNPALRLCKLDAKPRQYPERLYHYPTEPSEPLLIGGRHVCAWGACKSSPRSSDARYCDACELKSTAEIRAEFSRRFDGSIDGE